ncbi:dihydrolipoamide dehydrogenase [Bacillus safensis FO-36b] [Bacillus safensis subsp. safensis]
MEKLLSKKGITFVTNAKVLPDSVEKQENLVTIQGGKGWSIQTFEAEKLLLSVGRVPNIEGIGLENTDIQTEKQGIVVNEHYQTKESHIYAIGDVIGGLQLAHVASHEGMIAEEHMAGKDPKPLDETLEYLNVFTLTA